MMHSLRFRLLLTLIVVVTVAVGVVAVLASRVTASELQQYVERDMQRNRLVIDAVLDYYRTHTQAESPLVTAQELDRLIGERVIITDGNGQIMADSHEQLTGQTLGCEVHVSAVIVTHGSLFCIAFAPPGQIGMRVASPVPGDILFFDAPISRPYMGLVEAQELATSGWNLTIRRNQGAEVDPIQGAFIETVNRSLLLAAIVAGLVALMLTLALSRRILGPIEALTQATRRMEKGDLSQRVPVRSRDEIGVLAHAFNAMADNLARVEQLRRNMVTDVAHELRTPLTNIRGYLEALRDGVAKPDKAIVELLHEEALLLNRLVDDLQQIALAESGQLRLVCQPTPLAPIIEKAVRALQPLATDKQLVLGFDLPADLPAANIDTERIGQVVRNLLMNAISYTPAGGTIEVVGYQSGTEIAISVRDSGIGIASTDLPWIFERFFRADRSRARATGGAGLGLTIVKQLVEAHQGRVWAESTPGQGTTVTFMLPIAV